MSILEIYVLDTGAIFIQQLCRCMTFGHQGLCRLPLDYRRPIINLSASVVKAGADQNRRHSSYFTSVFVADGERAGTVMIARWRSMLCARSNTEKESLNDLTLTITITLILTLTPNITQTLVNRNSVATYRHHRNHFVVF